jgi:hypothetical protein
MPKIIPIIILIGIVFSMAFSPLGQLDLAAVTPTPSTQEPVEFPTGMAFWCLPEGMTYPKDPTAVEKSTQAVEAVFSDTGIVLNGPFSVCYLQLPDEEIYQTAEVAVYDQSNSAAWYTRKLIAHEEGLIAALKHSYLVNPPLWRARYRLEILDADGSALFSTPLVYQRKWQAERCWNGNMPNPTTLRCPLQQDLHPWDAGYGKPLPTVKPQ